MRIIIVGGGDVGEGLAEVLIKEKHDVTLIESDEKRAEELGERLDALVLRGDASDRKVLKDANIERCDALLALTSDDKTNLLVCEIAKSFNVPTIISRVSESSNEPIFEKMGITASINTITTAIMAFKRLLEAPGKRLIGMVGGNKIEIFERTVTDRSKILNKRIKDIKNRFSIAGILREEEFIKPKDDIKILEGDVLIICSPVEEVNRIDKLF